MDLFTRDVNDILKYVADSKQSGRSGCVYDTSKVDGQIYRILLVLKTKLLGHKIWYVDPVLARTPLDAVEEWGIHVEWGLDETGSVTPIVGDTH